MCVGGKREHGVSVAMWSSEQYRHLEKDFEIKCDLYWVDTRLNCPGTDGYSSLSLWTFATSFCCYLLLRHSVAITFEPVSNKMLRAEETRTKRPDCVKTIFYFLCQVWARCYLFVTAVEHDARGWLNAEKYSLLHCSSTSSKWSVVSYGPWL